MSAFGDHLSGSTARRLSLIPIRELGSCLWYARRLQAWGSFMPPYRIFCCDSKGHIFSRPEADAESDEAALKIAGDLGHLYRVEVEQGTRMIGEVDPARPDRNASLAASRPHCCPLECPHRSPLPAVRSDYSSGLPLRSRESRCSVRSGLSAGNRLTRAAAQSFVLLTEWTQVSLIVRRKR